MLSRADSCRAIDFDRKSADRSTPAQRPKCGHMDSLQRVRCFLSRLAAQQDPRFVGISLGIQRLRSTLAFRPRSIPESPQRRDHASYESAGQLPPGSLRGAPVTKQHRLRVHHELLNAHELDASKLETARVPVTQGVLGAEEERHASYFAHAPSPLTW